MDVSEERRRDRGAVNPCRTLILELSRQRLIMISMVVRQNEHIMCYSCHFQPAPFESVDKEVRKSIDYMTIVRRVHGEKVR
jgi:hypothetical protein